MTTRKKESGRTLRGMILSMLVWAALAGAASANPEPERIRTLIHVLDYVAADYAAAVQDGVVINAMEFEEMVQFAVIADSLLRGLVADGTLVDEAGMGAGLRALAADIDARAAPGAVAERARSIRDAVVRASGIAVAPGAWPDVASGERLYGAWCVACHGAGGLGDGPLAPTLDPLPANLAEGERIAGIAPFQVFNTIRLGVEGTGMTGFPHLSEQEAWDIAFFVKSIRTAGAALPEDPGPLRSHVSLDEVASLNDPDLEALLAARGIDRPGDAVAALRALPPPTAGAVTLDRAEADLVRSLEAYRAGRTGEAQRFAVSAYLEGVEPVEASLRAADASLVVEIEEAMMAVRGAIHSGRSVGEVEQSVATARAVVRDARGALAGQGHSPWLTFGLALSILLREALEAFLIIVTILGVIRVSGQPRAAHWVHAGWITAVLVGLAGWFLVDTLLGLSAARREVLEGGIALFAVVVLLSVGFWLHDTSSTRKWKAFIDRRVRTELGRGSLVGLATFAFFAVFREAFESVLFLSALGLDGGRGTGTAIGAAALVTLVGVLAAGMLAVRYSARLPVRQLFRLASWIVVVLAVVLAGKGVHALQEAGYLPVSLTGLSVRLELLGIYPTVESIVAQAVVVGTVALLWLLSRRMDLGAVRA